MRFSDILLAAKGKTGRIAVAAAHDAEVLEAVVEAAKLGIAKPILFGDKEKIESIAVQNGYDISTCDIVDVKDGIQAATLAVTAIRENNADILMKGMIQTADILRAVLNKEQGIRKEKLLSHVSIFESPLVDRLLFMTDGAMVTYPDIEQKVGLINNAVLLARSMGIETPKVAVIAAVEVINPAMQATIDAATLTMMNKRGQIKNCVVEGPLGLDNAISMEAAKHKGILNSDVAGQADILLVPDIDAGNTLYKAAIFMGGVKNAGLIIGAKAPIVLTSRADTAEAKLTSIACAVLMSNAKK